LKEHYALADFELPEIRRVDLAATVLALHAWGKSNPSAFGWFEAPEEQMIQAAERLLEMLGGLSNGSITPLGRKLLSIPAHPRIAGCCWRRGIRDCCARAPHWRRSCAKKISSSTLQI